MIEPCSEYRFPGLTSKNECILSAHQQQIFNKTVPAELFPEYFIIKVNNFDDVAKNSQDEWIYYLKNTELPERFKARGLKKVEERLMYDKMDTTARQQYDQYLKDVKISKSMIDPAKLGGISKVNEKGSWKGK